MPAKITNTTFDIQAANIGVPFSMPPVSAGVAYNAGRFSEDLSWAYYIGVGSTVTKTGQLRTMYADGVPLTFQRITGSGLNGCIEARYSTASMAPFVAGQRYFLSYYTYSRHGQWFWMRQIATTSDYGHAPKYSPPGVVTRHWVVVQATSTTQVDNNANPTLAFGAGTGAHLHLIGQGYTNAAYNLDLWIGGIQIEPISNSYVDGIALIGDSTRAGSSGGKDLPRDFHTVDNAEVSTFLSAMLQAPIYNRAIGGQRLDEMDARWATDITTLKQRCKYAWIQGGINDVNQGRTLEQMQASVQSMTAKAQVDGLIPRYETVTQSDYYSGVPAKELIRQQYNAWLIATYPGQVHDTQAVTADPTNSAKLHPAYYGDGTHYSGGMKLQVAKSIAASGLFQFSAPGKYQRADLPTIGAGNPARMPPVDKSGSITTGGTAQTAIAANQYRTGILIQNISAADLWINDLGAAAVQDSPSIRLAAGDRYVSQPGAVTPYAISIVGATTGQKFVAREW